MHPYSITSLASPVASLFDSSWMRRDAQERASAEHPTRCGDGEKHGVNQRLLARDAHMVGQGRAELPIFQLYSTVIEYSIRYLFTY